MKKKATFGTLVLFAVLAISTVSAQNTTLYFKPQHSIVSGPCQTTDVEIWLNTSGLGVNSIQTGIAYDPSCVRVTNVVFNTTAWMMSGWNIKCNGSGMEWLQMWRSTDLSGDFWIATITIECNCSVDCCETNLNFSDGVDPGACPFEVGNQLGQIVPTDTINGTFKCGAPAGETFSKDLYEGWNLISLPLTPSDNSTSSVLASVWDNVSAVYKYDATSKQFESASTMDPGEGYFVHVTQNCTWTYSGTPYTSLSTELKQGLNMVGWLNCSEDITDALSSIAGDYWYVARWNAVSQSFEVYNPVAPSSFNDFTAMDRGTGYFISAKADTTLSASC